jgi:hypothetical protein
MQVLASTPISGTEMTFGSSTQREFVASSFQVLKENVALRVCIIYMLISSLWILFSDQWMFSLLAEPADVVLIRMVKGIVFVMVTSGLVYLLVNRDRTC